jgi:hypothetical protein
MQLWYFLVLLVLGETCILHQLEAEFQTAGSEMDKTILAEFKNSHYNCSNAHDTEQMFEVFRQRWIDKMIDFTLEKLSITG